LGLQHPLTESDTSGATVLLNALATTTNTLMLDVAAKDTGGSWPTWYGGFDMQALRALYGTRAYASGNDVYAVADSTPNQTILDDGGIDTLDASTVSISASIDLRPGKTSSIGLDTDGTSKFNNLAIGNSTIIENVVGTLYDDVIVGNSQNNLITYTGGNDFVDGQEGVDTLRIWANAANSKIQKDMATGYWNLESVGGETGNMEIQNTERIFFADKFWALDTAANESAGRTAKILGAIFGKVGASNLEFRGIGLYFFDHGMGYEALTQLAIDARLGPGASKVAVAQLVQANVPGLVLNPNDYANVALLGVAAADSGLNSTMVNLTGLSTGGMEYLFFGG
jgi:serralysin